MKLHVTDSLDLLKFAPQPCFVLVRAIDAGTARAEVECEIRPQSFFNKEKGKIITNDLGLAFGYATPVQLSQRKPVVCAGDRILVGLPDDLGGAQAMDVAVNYLLVAIAL